MKRASIVNAYDLVYFDHVLITKSALDALIARATMTKPAPVKKEMEKVEAAIPATKVAAKTEVKKSKATPPAADKKVKPAAPKKTAAKKKSGGVK